MSSITSSTFADRVYVGCQKVAVKSTLISTKVDFFYKTTKVVAKFLEMMKTIFGSLPQTAANILNAMKGSIQILEGVSLVGTISDFVVPNAKGKYFLTDKSNSFVKIAEKVALFFHQIFKSINAAAVWGFISLANVVKYTIGQLPIFKLVCDGLYAVSNIFGICDASSKIEKSKKDHALAQSKMDKWNHRPAEVVLVRMGETSTIEAQKERYTKSLESKQSLYNKGTVELARLESDLPPTDAVLTPKQAKKLEEVEKQIETAKKDQAKLLAKIDTCRGRLGKIESKDFNGLANELEAKDSKKITAKMTKWETIKARAKSTHVSSALKIFISAIKITSIIIALVLIGINFWTLPITIGMAVVCFVSDGLGRAKSFYDSETV